ncbi:MAG: polysaccharide deacetylase family protein [Flavobacteriaceae bacterium]|jgi:peptidoglycan/xylan/chitin deacetylase (PgdA/CDA1 family)|nr:polysaccharide deacetylase family protein [Flavobacteriaceae bacterium]
MPKLPVLMYHNVCDAKEKVNSLCIHKDFLELQFKYLVAKGYKSLHLSELKGMKKLQGRSVVITFDDVTTNQKEFVLPLLKKYNLKANFFIPFAYIGLSDQWNDGAEPIMTVDDLKSLGELVELGHHSYLHRPYASLTKEEIDEDFKKSYDLLNEKGLNVFESLAFPYGNFPRKEPRKSEFFQDLKNNGMHYGLRIGNRLNSFPFKNPYLIERIEVKGDKSMLKFRVNLKFGKLV